MRISELSRISGVTIPTIKYYLREGLLPAGTLTARNQAEYDQAHVHRLRLIRALRDVGGLSVADIHSVLQAITDEQMPMHELLGVAHHALGPRTTEEETPPDVERARAEVDRFVTQLGWHVAVGAPGRRALAEALATLRRLGRDVDATVFRPYAELAERMATFEVPSLPSEASRADTVEHMVVGTVVYEAALVALRRMAQEHHSAQRFGATGPPAQGPHAEDG